MAYKLPGQVLKLFISIKNNNGDTITRERANIELDKNGVVDDKFYSIDQNRSILLSSLSSYQLALENEFLMPYGSLGENILIDTDIYHLLPGQRISIGSTILEITQNCTLCKGLSKIDPTAPSVLKNHRGIFAKTVTSGNIHINDTVRLPN